MEICVSNIAPDVASGELRRMFEAYGKVPSMSLNKVKGANGTLLVGFVEMPLRDEGLAAMKALNGVMLKGLHLCVTETTKKEEVVLT